MTDVRITTAHRPIDATVRLPGSKSLTNRALIIAGLARGASRLDGVGLADDTRYMMQCLKGLGIEVALDEPHCTATVQGCGGHIPVDEADLFCGNAGTVMRFGTAMCCLGAGRYRIDGVERMRNRPIGPLVDVLRDLGASIGNARIRWMPVGHAGYPDLGNQQDAPWHTAKRRIAPMPPCRPG